MDKLRFDCRCLASALPLRTGRSFVTDDAPNGDPASARGVARASGRAAVAADRPWSSSDHPVRGTPRRGKKHALRQLAAAFDPAMMAVHNIRLRPARSRRKAIGWRASGGSLPAAGRHGHLLPQLVPACSRRPHARQDRRGGADARVRRDQRVRGAAARLRHADRQTVLRRHGRSAGAATSASGLPTPWLGVLRNDEPDQRTRPRLHTSVRGPQTADGHALVAVADHRRR